MATILKNERHRMVFWDLFVGGVKVNEIFRKHIESINVVYSITQPTQAQITLNTATNIENFFTDGMKVEIKFGYLKTNMISMIKRRLSQSAQKFSNHENIREI